MREAIAHGIHHLPRNFTVCCSQYSINLLNVIGGLSDHFRVTDNGILNQFTGQESDIVDARCVTISA